MKTIGLLTMHRPINYGSALQTWATLKLLDDLGYDAEIIDYVYPNKDHIIRQSLLSKIKHFIVQALIGFPWSKKKRKFKQFWTFNYRLSKEYPTKQAIEIDNPKYDIYLVGSDQVWNPKMIKGDTTFLLDFVSDEKKKISLSSSFAVDKISKEYESCYKYYLAKFEHISVREHNGVNLIKNLMGRSVNLTLDPTLMLSSIEYDELVNQSNLRIEKPYILVYILKYAFNPYPYATKMIEEAYLQTGMQVVCIDFSRSQKTNIKNFIHLNDAISPQDFVWLFKHAGFVVTNSFHGAAFAVNFGKSLYAIVNPDSSDDRVVSFLSSIGLNDRIIHCGDELPKFTEINNPQTLDNLNEMRHNSKDYLINALRH